MKKLEDIMRSAKFTKPDPLWKQEIMDLHAAEDELPADSCFPHSLLAWAALIITGISCLISNQIENAAKGTQPPVLVEARARIPSRESLDIDALFHTSSGLAKGNHEHQTEL